jgi:hypothetical protein
MSLQITGDVLDLADELQEEFVDGAKVAMRQGSRLLRDEVRRRLRLRKGPVPAPEGEPPAEQTGELVRSIKVLPVRVRGRVVSGGIKTDHPGATRLEFGAVDKRGVRTFPHPFLLASQEAVADEVTRLLNEAIAGE